MKDFRQNFLCISKVIPCQIIAQSQKVTGHVQSYPHSITKTKLILTILNRTNLNCISKTMKLTSFRPTSPQNDPYNAILANALRHGLLLVISLWRA